MDPYGTSLTRVSQKEFCSTLITNIFKTALIFNSQCVSPLYTVIIEGRIQIGSVEESEPDFLAGAGAGEKTPAPGCCCLA